MSLLQKYLAPPEFEREEHRFTAHLLHRLLLLSMGIAAIMFVLLALLPQNRGYNMAASSFAFCHFGVSFLLLRRGHLMTAGWYYLGFLWLFITALSATVSGIFSPHLTLYSIVILLSAILLGSRYARAFAVLCIGSLALLALDWQNTDIAFDAGRQLKSQRAVIYLLMYSAVFIIITVVIEYASKQLKEYLQRWQDKEKELNDANRHLVSVIAQYLQTTVRLQESETRFRQIFEAAPIGMLIVGDDYRATSINRAMVEIFGYDYETYEMGSVLEMQTPEATKTYIEHMQKLFSGEVQTVTFENRLIRPDGERIWVRVTASVVRDDNSKPAYAIVMLQDITYTKEAEQRQIALAVERERSELLGEFMRHMTHDLKNPLSGIRSSAYLLKRKANLDGNIHYVERIEGSVDTLIAMIDNILATLRLEHIPEFDMVPLNINSMLHDIQEQMRSLIEHKQIRLQLDLADEVAPTKGDKEQLSHAFTNVIQNAIKYTPDGGTVILRTAQQADKTIIIVTDSGIGIPEDELVNIFDPFYRTQTARDGYVGTGLGLSLVKKVVDMHAGTIEVTSEIGVGTTFHIMLPALALSMLSDENQGD